MARVTKLIVDGPALAPSDQLSANGVNGKPFALAEKGFAARHNEDLRWRVSEGSDRMLHPVHIAAVSSALSHKMASRLRLIGPGGRTSPRSRPAE